MSPPSTSQLYPGWAGDPRQTNLDDVPDGLRRPNPSFLWLPRAQPWGTERVPGGSSGGQALQVAARLCAASHGDEPAARIVSRRGFTPDGIKPAYGRVSRGA